MSNLAPTHFVLVIGAMKCGTSTMFEHLSHFRNICPSDTKEPMFFADKTAQETGQLDIGLNPSDVLRNYRKNWSRWAPETHVFALEGSTNYTKMPVYSSAAERIADLIRLCNEDLDFRFIYLVRDPLIAIESFYRHAITELALNAVLQPGKRHWGEAYVPSFMGDEPIPQHPLDIYSYKMQLLEYIRCFGKERIFVATFEDFIRDPRATVAKVAKFLAINDSSWENCFKEKHCKDSKSLIPFLLNGKEHGNPVVTKEKVLGFRLSKNQREQAIRVLRPEAEKLQNHFGLDISSWSLMH